MSKNKYDKLQNYSTSIKPEKTIMEIEKMLSEFGAKKIMKEYDNKRRPVLLAFMVGIENQREIPIKLGVKIPQILMTFDEEIEKGLLPKHYSGDVEKAFKVGWRILKDWVYAQLTKIRLHQAKPLEVFLGFVYDDIRGETFYEKLEKNKFEAIGYNKEDSGG